MKRISLVLALLLVSLMPLSSLAQVTGLPTGGIPTASFTTMTGLLSIINTLINWFFVIVLVFAVIAFIWAGFMYVFSWGGGDTKAAKDIILYAIIGVIIAVLAKSFVWFAYNLATNAL
ncbi:MAG: hypothetical protein WC435_02195 [Candidatus Paceibacterota bacterium]